MRRKPFHSLGHDGRSRREGQVNENKITTQYILANTCKSIITADLIVPKINPVNAIEDLTRAMAHVGTFSEISLH